MDYLWLKAFHLASVAIWIGGMLLLSLAVAALPAEGSEKATAETPLVDAMARWNRWVTSPAMMLAWGLGILLAFQGDWFSAPWLWVKLPIIFALSGVHGALSKRLRRRTGISGVHPPSPLRFSGQLTIIVILVVAILAVAKPI